MMDTTTGGSGEGPGTGRFGQLVTMWAREGAALPVAVVVSVFDDLLIAANENGSGADAHPDHALGLDDILIDMSGVARLGTCAAGDVAEYSRLIRSALVGGAGDEAVPAAVQSLLRQATSDDPWIRPPDLEALRCSLRDALGPPAARDEVRKCLQAAITRGASVKPPGPESWGYAAPWKDPSTDSLEVPPLAETGDVPATERPAQAAAAEDERTERPAPSDRPCHDETEDSELRARYGTPARFEGGPLDTERPASADAGGPPDEAFEEPATTPDLEPPPPAVASDGGPTDDIVSAPPEHEMAPVDAAAIDKTEPRHVDPEPEIVDPVPPAPEAATVLEATRSPGAAASEPEVEPSPLPSGLPEAVDLLPRVRLKPPRQRAVSLPAAPPARLALPSNPEEAAGVILVPTGGARRIWMGIVMVAVIGAIVAYAMQLF